jgi:hypothetical protein
LLFSDKYDIIKNQKGGPICMKKGQAGEVLVRGRWVPAYVAEAIRRDDTATLQRLGRSGGRNKNKKEKDNNKEVSVESWVEILLRAEAEALEHAERNCIGCSEDYNPYDYLRLPLEP